MKTFTDKFIMTKTDYIPADVDPDFQEELMAHNLVHAKLYATMFFDLLTKNANRLPADLQMQGLRLLNEDGYEYEPTNKNEFIDYVMNNLGGLDDEFGDYSYFLAEYVEKEKLNCHILNRLVHVAREMSNVTAYYSFPSVGATRATNILTYIESELA